jgi:hypothetical protein
VALGTQDVLKIPELESWSGMSSFSHRQHVQCTPFSMQFKVERFISNYGYVAGRGGFRGFIRTYIHHWPFEFRELFFSFFFFFSCSMQILAQRFEFLHIAAAKKEAREARREMNDTDTAPVIRNSLLQYSSDRRRGFIVSSVIFQRECKNKIQRRKKYFNDILQINNE